MRIWPVALSLSVIVALTCLALVTPGGKRSVAAALLAFELMDPSHLQPLDFVTARPERDDVVLDAGDRSINAAVYRPRAGDRHGALVFAMGVKAWPLDDPRLERLAASLARAGLVVMAVESPGLRFDEMRSRDVEDLIVAYDYLSHRPYVDPARSGLLGVSAGGSLALVAAGDPRIADRVGFVDAVGAYFDAGEELRAVTVGDGKGWHPDAETARVARKQAIDTATDGDDRTLLDGIFYYGRQEERSEVASLSPQGKAVLALLDNSDAARFDPLYAGSGLAGNREFNSVSPARNIDAVRAQVRLLHSRPDRHIPIGQSEEASAALAGREGSYLEAFAAFDHVDPRKSRLSPALAADGARLYAYLLGLITRLGD